MRGRPMIMAGLLAAAFAAMAQPDDRQERTIEVTVQRGAIVVPEDGALIRRYHGVIRWQLTTPGYVFTDQGIVIIDAPEDVHVRCGTARKGREYLCHRTRHDAGATYKYDVELKSTRGRVLSLDPFIHTE